MSFVIKENFWENGPSPGGYYNYGYGTQAPSGPAKHTMYAFAVNFVINLNVEYILSLMHLQVIFN